MALPGRGFAPGRHSIEAYGRGGFRFGGISHVGSILALPSGVHAWRPLGLAEITQESLDVVYSDSANLDLLFIGTGVLVGAIAPEICARLSEYGIRFEFMQTSTAARTYNVLLQEGRRVGAALIAVE